MSVAAIKPYVRRPSDALLLETVKQHTANETYRILTDQGYVVSRTACERLRSRVVKEMGWKRPPRPRTEAFNTDPARTAARDCDRLEQALCNLYAKTAARLGCRLETAALYLNYTPTQIAKMQVAA